MEVFDTLFAPFVFIIEQLFLFAYNLSGNYGIAIILLSFFISILLLPIFIFIEKAKKKDDAIKLKMQPLVDEIKRCYKGQERYYYIRTLNRQYNYSPTRALIPIMSLIIQIPFFIAAYQFLENYAALEGVGFTFIGNLNAADALFGKINFLPIAMTLVNLITAYFYTRNGNTAERKQMLVVAGVFLVMLFNLPSGLVLYWTMNNVFSFFRLFITNPEVFKKVDRDNTKDKILSIAIIRSGFKDLYPKLKYVFVSIVVIGIYSQLNWAFKHHFNDIYIRIIGVVIGSFFITLFSGFGLIAFRFYKKQILSIELHPFYYYSFLFISIYFYLAAKFYFSGPNELLCIISLVALLPLQLIGLLYFIRKQSVKTSKWSFTIQFFLFLIFIAQLLNIIVLFSGKELVINMLSAVLTIKETNIPMLVLLGIIFVLITFPSYYKSHRINIRWPKKVSWIIYILAVTYIIGLIFLWKPLIGFSSDPDAFDFPAYDIIKNNYLLFFYSLIISVFAFVVVPKKVKQFFILLALVLVVISFLNSSIIPLNLGSLQVSRFSEQEKLAAPIFYYLIEVLLLIGISAGVWWVYIEGHKKIVTFTLIALNVFLIGQSIYMSIKTDNFLISNSELLHKEENTPNNGNIPFSKDKPNVVYYLIDGFQKKWCYIKYCTFI